MTTMEQKRKLAKFRSMTRNVRTSTTISLWICMLSSIGLLVASFLVDPLGEIHPSVLKGGSLLFAIAALAEVREAILEGFGVKLTHGDTVVELKDQDNNDNNKNPEEND